MLRKYFNKRVDWVEHHRFFLLLLATLFVLLIPAFSGKGALANIFFIISMSFLFIQSMIVASAGKVKRSGLRYAVVAVMIIVFWLEPAGIKHHVLALIQLCLLAIFFVFVTIFLVKFLSKSTRVTMNMIIAAINIYLLIGIIFGSLAFLLYEIYPAAYNFPESTTVPDFTVFIYYSFITMSTVGYGDITPLIPETRTLAYMTAITGQLYVAIIIAFLVGKMLMEPGK
jgi:hypothetical protein